MMSLTERPSLVQSVLSALPYLNRASPTHIVDRSASAALPAAFRWASAIGFSAGSDWTKPFRDQPSAPASSLPSMARVTSVRSAGGAPE